MLQKASFLRVFLFLVILVSNLFSLQKEEIVDKMTEKIDNVLAVLKNQDIDLEQKKNEIINIVNDVFDFELMAKIALGKDAWNSISKEEQLDFTKTFEEKLKKSYSDKLGLYNNQNVKIISLDPYNKTRLQLKTELLGKEGSYSINYNFYEKNGEWFIYDIDLVGVSIIQTYRQQFTGLLKEKSFSEMLALFKNQ